jgi:nitroreductase
VGNLLNDVMDAQEALLTRRTIHTYRPGPLPDGALDDAITAAHHAPNHKFTTPWRFTIVGDATRKLLVPVGIRAKAERKPLRDGQEDAIRKKLLQASGLVVVSRVRCTDPTTAREDYAACACAIQNMMLSLHSRGLASKWTTGGVTRHPKAYDVLGIDGAKEEVIGWVWVGWAERASPAVRPPIEDVVRRLP